MGYVGVGTNITLAVIDSGGARSMCDLETAQMLGVNWTPTKGAEYGTYLGVGGQPTPYTGAVTTPM